MASNPIILQHTDSDDEESLSPQLQAAHEPSANTSDLNNPILFKLYLSHFLSTWNARLFEFAAVLFLAVLAPNTLLYTSVYALARALAATLFAARLGAYIDRADRLVAIRASIVWQRVSAALSCLLFALLVVRGNGSTAIFAVCFGAATVLACVERLAAVGNAVAVERDWVVVVAESTGVERVVLNAAMRRIDLMCKLAAPVCISLVQSYSTVVAVLVVLVVNLLSVAVEYAAIARVYQSVPALAMKTSSVETQELNVPLLGDDQAGSEAPTLDGKIKNSFATAIRPWVRYCTSPVFLASFSLSILYLTVLSTGVQYQTYMLSLGFSALSVSLLRLAAVVSELTATCLAPILTRRIGTVRCGLWSINWQVAWLVVAILAFEHFNGAGRAAGAALTVGIVMSRLGLWGFDLAVQDIVQETTPPLRRGEFSASEVALQNLFEMLSFAATIVFPRPRQFRYPVWISFAAVALSACCFAAYVRKKRGHLLHVSDCIGREKANELGET